MTPSMTPSETLASRLQIGAIDGSQLTPSDIDLLVRDGEVDMGFLPPDVRQRVYSIRKEQAADQWDVNNAASGRPASDPNPYRDFTGRRPEDDPNDPGNIMMARNNAAAQAQLAAEAARAPIASPGTAPMRTQAADYGNDMGSGAGVNSGVANPFGNEAMADNPNINLQYQQWISEGGNPDDADSFRQHLLDIGAPDPGEASRQPGGGGGGGGGGDNAPLPDGGDDPTSMVPEVGDDGRIRYRYGNGALFDPQTGWFQNPDGSIRETPRGRQWDSTANSGEGGYVTDPNYISDRQVDADQRAQDAADRAATRGSGGNTIINYPGGADSQINRNNAQAGAYDAQAANNMARAQSGLYDAQTADLRHRAELGDAEAARALDAQQWTQRRDTRDFENAEAWRSQNRADTLSGRDQQYGLQTRQLDQSDQAATRRMQEDERNFANAEAWRSRNFGEDVRRNDRDYGEGVRRNDQSFGLQEGGLTGRYGGQNTLARDQMEADNLHRDAQLAEQRGEFDRAQTLRERAQGLDEEIQRGNLGVSQGRLGLDTELGRGNLDLQNREFDYKRAQDRYSFIEKTMALRGEADGGDAPIAQQEGNGMLQQYGQPKRLQPPQWDQGPAGAAPIGPDAYGPEQRGGAGRAMPGYMGGAAAGGWNRSGKPADALGAPGDSATMGLAGSAPIGQPQARTAVRTSFQNGGMAPAQPAGIPNIGNGPYQRTLNAPSAGPNAVTPNRLMGRDSAGNPGAAPIGNRPTGADILGSKYLPSGLKSVFNDKAMGSQRASMPYVSAQGYGKLAGTERKALDAALLATGTDPNDYHEERRRLSATTAAPRTSYGAAPIRRQAMYG